jgi:hypothetical protein
MHLTCHSHQPAFVIFSHILMFLCAQTSVYSLIPGPSPHIITSLIDVSHYPQIKLSLLGILETLSGYAAASAPTRGKGKSSRPGAPLLRLTNPLYQRRIFTPQPLKRLMCIDLPGHSALLLSQIFERGDRVFRCSVLSLGRP